ncbi:hypothetical protein [Limnohabitans sp.]|uniref:hypothetical protein n=1 Tax=Limnohabitans sp. TaxID=1907725 RepID=UPI00286F1D88|nr:hypothetical protein [Limnohabitans sp.]
MNGCSAISITDSAQDDLLAGFWFYQQQKIGLGSYFLENLMADIDSLIIYAGVHTKINGVHRSLASRFPYAIYYQLNDDHANVIAVLDTRRHPLWTHSKLAAR